MSGQIAYLTAVRRDAEETYRIARQRHAPSAKASARLFAVTTKLLEAEVKRTKRKTAAKPDASPDLFNR